MDKIIIEGLVTTELKIIDNIDGDILHGMKHSDPGFIKFGEAYFSSIKKDSIKAWKRHIDMTMNFIVPIGRIGFAIYDDRDNSSTYGEYNSFILSTQNYIRLTIPPMLWVGFKGLSKQKSFLLNIADITHNPDEVNHMSINEIQYNWSQLK